MHETANPDPLDHGSVDRREACENCDAPLHGEFCHRCGQSVHNPIRHAGHAVEEFFEAFWHLDGRVFRTLKDLLVPGRVACEYLAGHRQRYIAPMRLFVIFSVLTFFIGRLTIQVDTDPEAASASVSATSTIDAASDIDAINQSQTVEEVRSNRERLLAEVDQAREQAGFVPGVDAALITAKTQIRAAAATRIAELSGQDPAPAVAAVTASATTIPTTAPATTADAEADDPDMQDDPGDEQSFGGDWDPKTNPVEIGWLPAFANRWINRKMVHGQDNIKRMEDRPDLWLQAFMGSVPSALFLLVPVFALMLKLAYVFKRRLYLEHLVVALYSHVFLLMALAAMFLVSALGGWLEPGLPWVGGVATAAALALWLWMPAYLLFMQKRVYGQGWPMTTLKYFVVGIVYINLLAFATAIMFLATLVRT